MVIAFNSELLYKPPFWLRNGLIHTLYIALMGEKNWEDTISLPEPEYQEHIFTGANDTPIFGLVAVPSQAKGTIIATYGITGSLENQWFLKILGRKAYHAGYGVILFDWRSHGKTALLSPSLTSDGIYEGKDFLHIAKEGKEMGCPSLFWFAGYSLGGKLALWGVHEACVSHCEDIGGGGVICPSLDGMRSLNYLENDPIGYHLEQAITRNLRKLAMELYQAHPEHISLSAIERIQSIKTFDQYLVIPSLGFNTVEEYYQATSPLRILDKINKPTCILYAEDDPLFDRTIIEDLRHINDKNPYIDLILTKYGAHVGYISNKKCQKEYNDDDQWWAWNRFLQWIEHMSHVRKKY